MGFVNYRATQAFGAEALYGSYYGPGDVVGCLLVMGDPPATVRMRQRINLKGVEYLVEEERDRVASHGSSITFYKNGVSQGAAFTDVWAEVYYPAASLFKAATVTFNFGPDFECKPAGLDARPRFPPLLRFPLPRVRLLPCADLALSFPTLALPLELALGPSRILPGFGFGLPRALRRGLDLAPRFRVGVPPTLTTGRLLLAPPLPLDRSSRLVRSTLRVQLRRTRPPRVAVALRRCSRTTLW